MNFSFSKFSINKIIIIGFFIVSFLLLPTSIYSAEVLHVKNSSTIIIGDQNRNYTVKIACIEVNPSKDKLAVNHLESILPRHTKVNLKPRGSSEGVLISKVIKISSQMDIGSDLESSGFASYSC